VAVAIKNITCCVIVFEFFAHFCFSFTFPTTGQAISLGFSQLARDLNKSHR